MRDYSLFKILSLFFAIGLFGIFQAHGQMKIGNNPTQIHPFSILELESSNQALRLTQGDTAAVNAIIASDIHTDARDAAEGMIMLYNYSENGTVAAKDTGIYMRVNGYWHKIASAADLGWKLTGNANTDSASNFFGTTDAMGMRIGTAGNAAIAISRDGTVKILDSLWVQENAEFGKQVNVGDSLNVAGNAGFNKDVYVGDSLDVTGSAHIGDSLNVDNSAHIGGALSIDDSLVIGKVRDALPGDEELLIIGSNGEVRKMNIDDLKGIRKIAGLTGPDIHLEVSLNSDSTDFAIDSTTKANTIIFNIPYANGVTGAAKNGMVDSIAQSFAGAKSFRDSVAIGTTDAPNATLDVHGNINLETKTVTGDYDMSSSGIAGNDLLRTLLVNVDANKISINITLPTASKVDGRIYTIKKIGSQESNQIGLPVVIAPKSGKFGDGNSAMAIYNNWSSVTVQANGGSWYIVGH